MNIVQLLKSQYLHKRVVITTKTNAYNIYHLKPEFEIFEGYVDQITCRDINIGSDLWKQQIVFTLDTSNGHYKLHVLLAETFIEILEPKEQEI